MNTNRLCPLVFFCLTTAAFAQQSASIDGPPFVKAGEQMTLTFHLDRAPNFEGSALEASIVPENGGGGFSQGEILSPGQTDCKAVFPLPRSAVGGTWVVSVSFFTGSQTLPLRMNKFTFEVIPDKSLVFPTSAEIGINESQAQILRREAIRLQSAIQDLKGRITETGNDPKLVTLLVDEVTSRKSELLKTETEFNRASADERTSQDSNAFFADIRAQYDDVLNSLNSPRNTNRRSASNSPATFRLIAATRLIGYPALAQGALRVMEHNELAYTTVADADRLTFDLQVESTPSDATISYKRYGSEFKVSPDKTNATIKSLTFAIWVVSVEAPGYKEQRKEHDPFTESNHVLHFDLKK
jgi:hypothetical protein